MMHNSKILHYMLVALVVIFSVSFGAIAQDKIELIIIGHQVHLNAASSQAVSYTHLRAHETPEHLVCRLLLEKKKKYYINMKKYYIKL